MSGRDGGRVGAVDLDGTTVQELTTLIAAAEAKRREKLGEAKAALRAEAERRAAELGLSAGDLFARTARQESTGQEIRRYRPRSNAGSKRARLPSLRRSADGRVPA